MLCARVAARRVTIAAATSSPPTPTPPLRRVPHRQPKSFPRPNSFPIRIPHSNSPPDVSSGPVPPWDAVHPRRQPSQVATAANDSSCLSNLQTAVSAAAVRHGVIYDLDGADAVESNEINAAVFTARVLPHAIEPRRRCRSPRTSGHHSVPCSHRRQLCFAGSAARRRRARRAGRASGAPCARPPRRALRLLAWRTTCSPDVSRLPLRLLPARARLPRVHGARRRVRVMFVAPPARVCCTRRAAPVFAMGA